MKLSGAVLSLSSATAAQSATNYGAAHQTPPPAPASLLQCCDADAALIKAAIAKIELSANCTSKANVNFSGVKGLNAASKDVKCRVCKTSECRHDIERYMRTLPLCQVDEQTSFLQMCYDRHHKKGDPLKVSHNTTSYGRQDSAEKRRHVPMVYQPIVRDWDDDSHHSRSDWKTTATKNRMYDSPRAAAGYSTRKDTPKGDRKQQLVYEAEPEPMPTDHSGKIARDSPRGAEHHEKGRGGQSPKHQNGGEGKGVKKADDCEGSKKGSRKNGNSNYQGGGKHVQDSDDVLANGHKGKKGGGYGDKNAAPSPKGQHHGEKGGDHHGEKGGDHHSQSNRGKGGYGDQSPRTSQPTSTAGYGEHKADSQDATRHGAGYNQHPSDHKSPKGGDHKDRGRKGSHGSDSVTTAPGYGQQPTDHSSPKNGGRQDYKGKGAEPVATATPGYGQNSGQKGYGQDHVASPKSNDSPHGNTKGKGGGYGQETKGDHVNSSNGQHGQGYSQETAAPQQSYGQGTKGQQGKGGKGYSQETKAPQGQQGYGQQQGKGDHGNRQDVASPKGGNGYGQPSGNKGGYTAKTDAPKTNAPRGNSYGTPTEQPTASPGGYDSKQQSRGRKNSNEKSGSQKKSTY